MNLRMSDITGLAMDLFMRGRNQIRDEATGKYRQMTDDEIFAQRENRELMAQIHAVEAAKRDQDLARLKAILEGFGLEIDIGGCGCCGSPWYEFKLNGETIFESNGNFNNFKTNSVR